MSTPTNEPKSDALLYQTADEGKRFDGVTIEANRVRSTLVA